MNNLSLRDYFAAKAMVGMIIHRGDPPPSIRDEMAVRAYASADAMLKARSHQEEAQDPCAWQLIVTAPRDGRVFLAFRPHEEGGLQFTCTLNIVGQWISLPDGGLQKPTHWRLLPEPPPCKS